MEKSPDILYEYNSFPSFSCFPKYDDYFDDDGHNDKIGLVEESEPSLAESNVQDQQLEPSDQCVHFSYEEEEENAENFDFSEGTLPFCFESFQFIKDNYHAVCNQVSSSVDIDHLEESQILSHNALPLVLQPQSAIEYQIEEEDSEAATDDQMIQVDPLPLCFQSFELFKEEEEQQVPITQVPSGPVCNELQVSFQILYDPFAGRLYDGINKLSSPLAGCKVQNQDVGDFQIQGHDSNPKPLYSCLNQLSNCVYMLQDPFVQCLDSAKQIRTFLFSSKFNKVIYDGKISISSISKHKQQSSLTFIMRKWLHCLFHFT